MTEVQQIHLEHLRNLVAVERAAERQLHIETIQQLPLNVRVEKGYTWYPLQLARSGFGIGGRPYVTLERPEDDRRSHQFRAGQSVNFFSNVPGIKQASRAGIVQQVKRNRIKVILNGHDLPDWADDGKIGLDQLFDERTYQEMDKALAKLQEARGDRTAELRDVLMGAAPATFEPVPDYAVFPGLPGLNESQQAAADGIQRAHQLAVVHGPPGTGKTTTITATVAKLAETESTILVTAPSNSAVDLLTIRLAERGLRVVRIGNISRVEEDVLRHSLDVQLAQHPDTKEIKKVRQQAAELRTKAKRWKRGAAGHEHGRNRGMMFREAGQLNGWANQLEDRLLDQILGGAQVITCTLVGAATSMLDKYHFPTVVIDEAAQALEPATWIPILKASRVVLAGDPYQLPPTVKSDEARRGGLEITLMERIIARGGDAVFLLRTQYRMHRDIMGFSNQRFYDGLLEAAPGVAEHRLPYDLDERALVFIDTAGTGFEEHLHPTFKSRYNEEELLILREHLYQLIGGVPPEADLPRTAIISPYREQVLRADQLFHDDEALAGLPLTIKTIDGFQGRERDLVYISLVRSNGNQEIGFLKDYRRMNVALTRARKKLVVVGDSSTIGGDTFYADFLTYVEKHGSYQTAWEYMG
ncbi:MAG: AAA domain-containing protein [Saprospiraceae bacterium]